MLKVAQGNRSMAAAAVLRYASLVKELGYWYALATMDSHSNVVCAQQYQSEWFAALGSMRLYRYVFAHATSNWPQRVLNATHTAELPYLFRNASVLGWFLGYRSFSDKEQALSNSLATAWASFARSGDPNPPATGDRFDRSWEQFEAGNRFTFVFDTAPKLINGGPGWPNANDPYCSFWASRFLGPFPP